MATATRARRINISGIVQGVGFRPFIHGLADRLDLRGWIRNTSAGVDIVIEGESIALQTFMEALTAETPPLAHIEGITSEEIEENGFTSFEIISSQPIPGAFQPISPDVCICDDCLRELFDPDDRHYRYPFVNCTNCGPRFTIIKDVPYDRPLTTMASFEMCADCEQEYNNPDDRRFHAQPVACPACGPGVWLEVESERIAEGGEAITALRELLQSGKIAAIKGLGGFHLACDASNSTAVDELRRRKLRVDKPFALMMLDADKVKRHCFLNEAEQELLEDRSRPIVILAKVPSSPIAERVTPNQSSLGVMLPYTPLHYLIMEPAPDFPEALVMTSGNLSDEPIATGNGDSRRQLADLADAFLMHDRDIHTRCDDSVVRVFSTGSEKKSYPLRRSRGFTPFPIMLPRDAPPLLATGAELKNTFCLAKDRYAFLSHHIGDMENYETLLAFESGVAHFEHLFRMKPEFITHDLHPDYMATRYALQRAEVDGIAAVGVQHHHAHIAACMLDNGLSGDKPMIGVAFDGTGYGQDGNIWGGEFLLADYGGYERAYHLAYAPLAGGDQAVRQPWRMALAWLSQAGLPWEDDLPPVQHASQLEMEVLQHQLASSINTAPTSSMGRLFDAAASLCGVRQIANYEAQAAIEFEALVDPAEQSAYQFEIDKDTIIDPTPLFHCIIDDLRRAVPGSSIAARFHNGVAKMVLEVCLNLRDNENLNQVALSGGVWQNMALLEKSCQLLSSGGFEVYTHHKVPTNDGGLALGQAAIGAQIALRTQSANQSHRWREKACA